MIKEIVDIPNRKEAEKSGLYFCKSTKMYGIFIDNELAGYAGLILKKDKAVLKNAFIFNQFRGKGLYKKLIDFRIQVTKDKKVIEATCTKMSINEYLKRGFKIVQEYKHYTKVRHENL